MSENSGPDMPTETAIPSTPVPVPVPDPVLVPVPAPAPSSVPDLPPVVSSSSSPSIFRLFQKFVTVSLDDEKNQLELILWKPNSEEIREGQLYLLDRVSYWETTGNLKERVTRYIETLPEDKDSLITRILDETIGQKLAENMDLVDQDIKTNLELYHLKFLTARHLEPFSPRSGVDALLSKTISSRGDSLSRADILPLVGKPDQLEEYLDRLLLPDLEKAYRKRERDTYQKQEIDTLRKALIQVSRRTLSLGMAMQDWNYFMLSNLTRMPSKESGIRGDRVFTAHDKSTLPSHIGQLAPEVLAILSESLGRVVNLGNTKAVREAAADVNFPPTATLPEGSTSQPQEAVEKQTSPSSPSISSES